MRNLMRRAVVLTALLAAAGCGGGLTKTKVTGSVTYNGKALDDGYIVFRPADGKGSDAGGPIVSGNYTLTVTEGQKVVVISSAGSPQAGKVLSSDEASKLQTDPKKAGEVIIDPNAKGNNAKVEVKGGGDQSFDFALKSGS